MAKNNRNRNSKTELVNKKTQDKNKTENINTMRREKNKYKFWHDSEPLETSEKDCSEESSSSEIEDSGDSYSLN